MSIKIKNGIPKIINNLTSNVLQKACEEIGITKVADIQAITPVDTGSLRRSISFDKVINKNTAVITFGSDLIYAAKVEFKNKSYLRAAFNDNKVQEILLKHLKGLVK